MARPANQSKNWNFTVVQEQITHKGKPTGYFGNFREDTGACLGMTTDQYGIVQNSDLLDAAKSALDKRGLSGYEESIIVAEQGKRMYAKFTFRDKQIASGVGDIFGYALTLRNSFDRSLRAAFALGFERLICSNGMSTMEKEFGLTRKHSTKIAVDFIADAVDKAFNHGQNALKVYDQMAQVGITDEQGVFILGHLEQAKAISGTLADNIKTLWLAPKRAEDKARNLYNLYNAVTEYLTHNVQDERFEYADKVNNSVLLRLVNAARNKATLAKLIVPVQPSVTVSVDPAKLQVQTGAGIIDVEAVAS